MAEVRVDRGGAQRQRRVGYLTARTEARKTIELEKERNYGTETAIKALPPGAQLLESERDGRLRLIIMPSHTRTSRRPRSSRF